MRTLKEAIISATSFPVFAFLDLIDFSLCFFYQFIDFVFDENPTPCYCRNTGREVKNLADDNDGNREISETLFERKNLFRDAEFFSKKEEEEKKKKTKGGSGIPRWSDCYCETCFTPEDYEGTRLLFYVFKEKNPAEGIHDSSENVIFLHGNVSSSSMWVNTVFPNLSEDSDIRVKLFAIDLLGFGRSPKPTNCSYTIWEHLQMIDITVIKKFRLNSFHIVAHSMGCILALALAAEYPNSVKSITLVAPPYFSSLEDKPSHNVLNILAERKIWPPLLFGCSVMTWYEHLGRTIHFIICRNHSIWEWIIRLMTMKRQLPFMMTDLTKHTHRSTWLTMHNVICGGAKMMDKYLDSLKGKEIIIKIIHGSKDQIVPLQCSYNMKARVPQAELKVIYNADHSSVILDRKEDLTRDLEETWASSSQIIKH